MRICVVSMFVSVFSSLMRKGMNLFINDVAEDLKRKAIQEESCLYIFLYGVIDGASTIKQNTANDRLIVKSP